MKPFAYVKAANEQQALAALGRERGKVMPLAGGMDLVSLLKDRIATPDRLVNVKGLDATITATPDGGLRIGAAVRLVDLQAHATVTSQYEALMEAAAEVGTPQIRNLGTVGGNLMQRPRCWYFRNEEFPCLKKGGARCYSVDGENQFHAILGGGPCHIVHPSSLAVPLVAFGAKLRIAGPRGEKEVLAEEFFELPERNLYGETALRPDELLTHVILPPAKAMKSATYEVRFRSSHDWPIAFASVALQLQGTTVERRSRGARRGGADSVAVARSGSRAEGPDAERGDGDQGGGGGAGGGHPHDPERVQGAGGEDRGQARAAARGRRHGLRGEPWLIPFPNPAWCRPMCIARICVTRACTSSRLPIPAS